MPASTPAHVIERILDSMDDGVLVVDPNGAFLTCNAAASRVLGLDGAPPAGASFGETFLVVEGLDAFTGVVLDAVQAAPARARPAGRRVVDVRVGGEPRSIALATTYLRGGPRGAHHGAAVVAVFSDITEIAALREAEVRGQADADARERAELEYRNLREQLEGLRKVMEAAVVRAPVGGIVMAPALGPGARAGSARDGRLLEGVSVADGQALVQIADIETLSVAAVVEEVEVTKLRVGQPVRVTGDAFPGIELGGELVEVASHASSSAPRGERAVPGAGAARYADAGRAPSAPDRDVRRPPRPRPRRSRRPHRAPRRGRAERGRPHGAGAGRANG